MNAIEKLQEKLNAPSERQLDIFRVGVTGALTKAPNRNTQITVIGADAKDAIGQIERNYPGARVLSVNHVGRLGVYEYDRCYLQMPTGELLAAQRDIEDLIQQVREAKGKLALSEARIAELEAALKPFAILTGYVPPWDVGDSKVATTASDVRRAATVLFGEVHCG